MITGRWWPNYNLSISVADQRAHMEKIGDICKCGYVENKCKCKCRAEVNHG
jgi:hypothetical protein